MPGCPSKPLRADPVADRPADPVVRWLRPAVPAEARDEGSGLDEATGVGREPRR